MSNFRTTHTQTLSVTANQAVFMNLQGGTIARVHLHEINLSNAVAATPGAIAAELALRQSTDAGTGGTALDEINTNPPGPAATVLGTGGNHTTDPANAAATNLLRIGLRQEIPWRWLAYPGREIISIPAAADGLALVTVSIVGASFACLGSLAWME
jgi:hypothetical protein